ncbi:DUF1272 domain-containing protein [uncultured Roseobacter sp.]|uniref:DUF1272 domain-containing protein n=1 Tax=uncultured Roseobacter sp. TaxID=114847 RepID=UPI00261FC74C|nr:DUF1272 domain-containing protein [uncultured Roseobacter sp.]
MLILKPNCECCDRGLPPSSTDAVICSFECTFCKSCAEQRFANICPNCGGNFASRPLRPKSKLSKFPASTERYRKAHVACSDFDV